MPRHVVYKPCIVLIFSILQIITINPYQLKLCFIIVRLYYFCAGTSNKSHITCQGPTFTPNSFCKNTPLRFKCSRFDRSNCDGPRNQDNVSNWWVHGGGSNKSSLSSEKLFFAQFLTNFQNNLKWGAVVQWAYSSYIDGSCAVDRISFSLVTPVNRQTQSDG